MNQKIPTSEHANIVKMYERGATLREIGDRYKVSGERIRQLLRQMDIPSEPAWLRKHCEDIPEWIEAYSIDINPRPSINSVAQQFGVSYKHVRAALAHYGVSIRSIEERIDDALPKICSWCGEEQPPEEYSSYTDPKGVVRKVAHCADCNSKKLKNYYATPTGKQNISRGNRRQEQKRPDKRAAYSAVAEAIKNGALLPISDNACVYCNSRAQQYHHYAGYEPDNWLDVEPVCVKCHKRECHNGND